MRINKLLRLLTVASIFIVLSTVFVVQSCRKYVDPISYYTNEGGQMIQYTILNSDTKLKEPGVVVLVTFSDGENKVLQADNGEISIDVKDRVDGDITICFEKDGFLPLTRTINIDRSDVEEGSEWRYPSKVLLTQINESFDVIKGVEKIVNVKRSKSMVNIKFPDDCISQDAKISVTETPVVTEVAGNSSTIEIVNERVAYSAFVFKPDGQIFDKPIEVTMELPELTKDYVFSTFKDGNWEDIPVVKNPDGTGTALVSHFSDYILTTRDRWKLESLSLSGAVLFKGDCDSKLNATMTRSFDSDETRAKDDLSLRIRSSFSLTKTINARRGYYREVSARYVFWHLRNVTKDYTLDVPSIPVIWSPVRTRVCHTGGAGQ